MYLIRHGSTDAVGKMMSGWLPGVHLNSVGLTQADKLAARILHAGIAAIYSSPLERALETAAPLARNLGLEIVTHPALGEVHAGELTGQSFADLDTTREWQLFNSFRSSTRLPGGELMLEVQARVISQITELCRQHPEDAIAMVSHGDVIRAAVCHYLGIPLDFMQRFEISPGSVTILRVSAENAVVLRLNDTGED
jgi:probable phosphoglycerate mutase